MTDTKPKQYRVSLQAAPKLGNLYWCQFPDPEHVHLPEMWKKRPVVVVSRKNVLKGKVLVVPLSTEAGNEHNPFALRLSDAVSQQIDGLATWILCDHIVAVATSRLSQHKGGSLKVRGDELADILDLTHSALGTAQRQAPKHES